jgi:hypothetical protein
MDINTVSALQTKYTTSFYLSRLRTLFPKRTFSSESDHSHRADYQVSQLKVTALKKLRARFFVNAGLVDQLVSLPYWDGFSLDRVGPLSILAGACSF